ncbi:MAG: oxidoreductase [Solirubrobacteraceae bacterium]
MTSTRWTAGDLPDMAGRSVVVTGANSGIGAVTARELARAGARVVLAVRDVARGEAAARSMPGSTEVRRLDLADLASVRAFADEWEGPLDILINNAGVMAVAQGRTVDGFELQIATNHFGPFALTNLLLAHITDRIVTVASVAHRGAKIDFDDLHSERGYSRWRAYGQSKLANLLFTLELQRRLDVAGSRVSAHAAHPGWAATSLQAHSASRVERVAMALGNRLIAQSDAMGALPTLYAATQNLPAASYTGPGGFQEVRGHPKAAGRSIAAGDKQDAQRLWERSEQLTGVTFPLAWA